MRKLAIDRAPSHRLSATDCQNGVPVLYNSHPPGSGAVPEPEHAHGPFGT